MDNISKHYNKLSKSEINDILHDLGHSSNRHDVYHKFRALDNDNFHHMKDAAKYELGNENHYFAYPEVVLFRPEDDKMLKLFADPSVTQYYLTQLLEKDNEAGGINWNSIKNVAKKAAKIYRPINNVAHTIASFAKDLPLPPKLQIAAQALATGTDLHNKILDKIDN